MPKRTDINTILIIGSGPVVIGQGTEYDYSAAQAGRALREEGCRVVVVNSNPATISTEPDAADRVYIEPLTLDSLTKIIEKEKPDAILAAFGGETALRLVTLLDHSGVLKRNGVEVIGASVGSIEQAEDRSLLRQTLSRIGVDLLNGEIITSIEDGIRAVREIGFPAALRPAYTTGGAGSAISYNIEEFVRMLAFALKMSPTSQALIEQSVMGWKEIEIVLLRDSADNAMLVTSIEYIDPAGVHSGDSTAVVPAQTISGDALSALEQISKTVIRALGIIGAAAIRCAVDRAGRAVALGVTPCVGGACALASHATGLEVAKVSARLTLGLDLDEIGCSTWAAPSGYCAVKSPRFAFDKFPDSDPTLGTSMKSVGRAVAIGRTFPEALQKSVRSPADRRFGLGADGADPDEKDRRDLDIITNKLVRPNAERLFYVRRALKSGMSAGEISDLSGIDPWFIERINELVQFERKLEGKSLVGVPSDTLQEAKRLGYSDVQLAFLLETDEEQVRLRRRVLGIENGYSEAGRALYSNYDAPTGGRGSRRASSPGGSPSLETEAFDTGKKKFIIIGAGPNRIGQGGEFDYSVALASSALIDANCESIIVNSNPDAVSSDPDLSSKLYMVPLTHEDLLDAIEREKPDGVISQLGGPTAVGLGCWLEKAGVPILGISVKSIDRVTDRKLFTELLRKLDLRQMENDVAASVDEALRKAGKIGYPVLVRPSRVSGTPLHPPFGRGELVSSPPFGRGERGGSSRAQLAYDADDLKPTVRSALETSPEHSVMIHKFLEDAIEVSVDAISDGGTVIVCGVMEHIEQAGVHAGDSASSLPPHSLPDDIVNEIKRQASLLASELGIRGLINSRYAVKGGRVFVLNVNPGASRTIPFVSKATGIAWARAAARVLLGESLKDQGITAEVTPERVSVKEAVFPFIRFPGADVALGPDMKSSGMVMGIDSDFGGAYIKAQIAADQNLPQAGAVFLSVADRDKKDVGEIGRKFKELGFDIVATRGTAKALKEAGVDARVISKIEEGRPDAIDLIKNGDIDLIVNTRSGKKPRSHEITIRSAVIARGIPIITTMAGAKATLFGMETARTHGSEPRALRE